MNLAFDVIDAAAVPVVIGLVQIAKKSGWPEPLCPLLAVVFGIFAVIVNQAATGAMLSWQALAQSLLVGVPTGLAASGLWSGSKAMAQWKPT